MTNIARPKARRATRGAHMVRAIGLRLVVAWIVMAASVAVAVLILAARGGPSSFHYKRNGSFREADWTHVYWDERGDWDHRGDPWRLSGRRSLMISSVSVRWSGFLSPERVEHSRAREEWQDEGGALPYWAPPVEDFNYEAWGYGLPLRWIGYCKVNDPRRKTFPIGAWAPAGYERLVVPLKIFPLPMLLNMVLVALALEGLARLLRQGRSALRARRGRCPKCGYDLAGLGSADPAVPCPECGATR